MWSCVSKHSAFAGNWRQNSLRRDDIAVAWNQLAVTAPFFSNAPVYLNKLGVSFQDTTKYVEQWTLI